MAFSWNLGDVKNWRVNCLCEAEEANVMQGIEAGDVVLRPRTRAVIDFCFATNTPLITEQGVKQMWTRMELLRTVMPNSDVDYWEHGEKYRVTEQDLRDHIGLSCNTPPMSNAKYRASIERIRAARIAS